MFSISMYTKTFNNFKQCINRSTKLNTCLIIDRSKVTKPNLRFSNLAEDEKKVSPFGWFLLLIPATTFGLGCWQVQRKRWKEQLISDLQSRVSQQPVPLPENVNEISAMEYNPVEVRGHYIHERSVLMGPRSLLSGGDAASQGGLMSRGGKDSTTGYHVVTPFQLADRNESIMINRGWIPANQRHSVLKTLKEVTVNDKPKEEIIVGVVRHTEDRPPMAPANKSKETLLYRDLPLLSELTGASLPIFLDAQGTTSAPGEPIPNQTRVTLRNEHLSYILTWFSLSAFTSVMWYMQIAKRLPLP